MSRWMPFEWIVALRFLREGRMQTLFIVAGIAIGVAVIVFMSALLTGLQSNFIRRVLTAQAHIQLLPPKEVARPLGPVRAAGGGPLEDAIIQAPLQRLKSIDQWQTLAAQVRAMPEVAVVSPIASGSALVIRGEASRAISVIGVDPALYFRIVALPEKMVRGTTRLTPSDILIGTDLASDLGVAVGDKLRVSAAGGGDQTLAVTGLFDLGSKPANQRTTYVALRTAQSLLGLVGGVSAIDVTVKDIYAAEAVAQRITAANGVQADSWIATNAQFFTAVQAQKTSNTAIRFFVALSVAFGIASVLVVSVVQKSREIGILRAMGISRGQVLRVFLLQGGLLGLTGSVGGSSIGLVALLLWQRYALNPDGTPLFPLAIEPGLFVASLLLATLTGLAAAFAPALRAARLDPVVAIRG
ncbi:FtsX-like permease family protein (plasmid) [Variovorax sp. V59]|uniref:ABC transporter permease n=1 Tax=unclassified Variovorax TaxID=663243 RepID=UPI0017822AA5|nr:FtsX-like permease family protein [Variovorax sp. VRV01]MBD9666920.1 ABC transporter permease [Variovorax sp. VRV01]